MLATTVPVVAAGTYRRGPVSTAEMLPAYGNQTTVRTLGYDPASPALLARAVSHAAR